MGIKDIFDKKKETDEINALGPNLPGWGDTKGITDAIKPIVSVAVPEAAPAIAAASAVTNSGTKPNAQAEKKPSIFEKIMGAGKSYVKSSTVMVCPVHGPQTPTPQGTCPQCGQKLKSQTTGSGTIVSFGIFMLSLLGSAYLFLNSIITDSIAPLIVEFIPAITVDMAALIVWGVIALVGLLIGMKIMKMSIVSGIILSIVMIVVVFIGSMILPAVGFSGGSGGIEALLSNPMIQSFLCIFQNMGNMQNLGSSSGMMDCGTTTNPSTATAQKIGSYDVADFSFGSEFSDPAFTLSNMQATKGKVLRYIFPITITNPSTTDPISNFSVFSGKDMKDWESSIFNDSATAVGGIPLTPDVCDGVNDSTKECRIPPEDQMSITVDSGVDFNDTRSKTLSVKVSTQYSYSNEGKGGFMFARSAQDLKYASRAKSTTNAGPVDVVVYFSPDGYISGATKVPVNLFIVLKNSGKGSAFIKSITIHDLNAGMLGFTNCRLPNGQYISSEDFDVPYLKLSKQATYVCKYDVTGNLGDIPFKSVVFSVNVEYQYREAHTQEVTIDRNKAITP